jgi:nicotinic acid mononucleotide adenylyltransferase
MCASLNIPVRILDVKTRVSATEIRNRMMANEPCSGLMPPAILKYLQNINFWERLQLINHQYER